MRDMGLRGLLFYCSDYKCSHLITTSGDRWADDTRLSDLEPRFACSPFGRRGADVRPNFNWNRNPVAMMVASGSLVRIPFSQELQKLFKKLPTLLLGSRLHALHRRLCRELKIGSTSGRSHVKFARVEGQDRSTLTRNSDKRRVIVHATPPRG